MNEVVVAGKKKGKLGTKIAVTFLIIVMLGGGSYIGIKELYLEDDTTGPELLRQSKNNMNSALILATIGNVDAVYFTHLAVEKALKQLAISKLKPDKLPEWLKDHHLGRLLNYLEKIIGDISELRKYIDDYKIPYRADLWIRYPEQNCRDICKNLDNCSLYNCGIDDLRRKFPYNKVREVVNNGKSVIEWVENKIKEIDSYGYSQSPNMNSYESNNSYETSDEEYDTYDDTYKGVIVDDTYKGVIVDDTYKGVIVDDTYETNNIDNNCCNYGGSSDINDNNGYKTDDTYSYDYGTYGSYGYSTYNSNKSSDDEYYDYDDDDEYYDYDDDDEYYDDNYYDYYDHYYDDDD